MYKSSDENDDEGSDIVSAPEPQLPHFDSDSDPERLGFFQASSESDPEFTEDAKIVKKMFWKLKFLFLFTDEN